eukprot:6172771-Pleurochrysis_carterae.AAC.1
MCSACNAVSKADRFIEQLLPTLVTIDYNFYAKRVGDSLAWQTTPYISGRRIEALSASGAAHSEVFWLLTLSSTSAVGWVVSLQKPFE